MEEVWKDIFGYENKYQVSNLGNVRSLGNANQTGFIKYKVPKKLRPKTNRLGYKFVNLSKNNKTKMFAVHRLVAIAFLNNNDFNLEVNHKDENPSNNNVDNLEWCTHKYNMNYGTQIERARIKKFKPILQYSIDGKLIKEWKCIRETESEFNHHQNIIYCLKGKSKSAYGYIWKYKNN